MAGLFVEVAEEHLSRLSKATAAAIDREHREDGKYRADVPNHVESATDSSIELQKLQPGSSKQLALTLRLQTAKHERREPIKQTIDGGIISITFE